MGKEWAEADFSAVQALQNAYSPIHTFAMRFLLCNTCHLTDINSTGLMPTEARGNYLPEAPYLRETKCQRPI